MASREWLGQSYIDEFKEIQKIENIHPAINSLCSAMLNLSNVRPTSLTQQAYLVHATTFIIRAINAISNRKGSYVGVNIVDPMEMLGEGIKKEEVTSNVIPFPRGV